jgi:DtxR family Mn-dependent transcriptional regulator
VAHGLIDSTEMYLRTVLELEEEGIPALRARLAERLGLSAPSVSEGVARLEGEGLLRLDGERIVRLTDDGRDLATRVLRKHRLAERLLVDVIGLEREFVHEEACRWEHVISDRVEDKLAELLGNPTTSPYGNPIPGAEVDDVEVVALADADEGRVRIERISEQLQGQAELMHLFDRHGVRAGSTVEVTEAVDGLVIALDGHEVPIDRDEARLVYVSQVG